MTVPPSFPSLYWPLNDASKYESLSSLHDIWRFTVIWSYLLALPFYLVASVRLGFVLDRDIKMMGIFAILTFLLLIAIAIFVGSSLAGVALAVIYNTGEFTMSTYVPLLWAFIQMIFVIIGSYATITAIL